MYKVITSAIILLLLFACAENNRIEHGFQIVETKEGYGTHPILTMDVIEIPSTGEIIGVDGEAKIKKQKLNGYEKAVTGTKINEKDILWLKKDAVVEIQFEDGSRVANKPVSQETFYTFEHINH